MDKQTLDPLWDNMRWKYGIYLRLLEVIPEDQFHANPVQGMRTPAELVVHTSGSIVRNAAQGVANGEVIAMEPSEDSIASGLATKADVISFARACWDDAEAAVASIGDAELGAMVPTSMGMSLPGWILLQILREEFLHHRGQLYVYARACGAEPPILWSFPDNPPGFRPPQGSSP